MTSSTPLTTSGQINYPDHVTPGNNSKDDAAKLPDDFDPFKHLQQQYIPLHNQLVKHWFADTERVHPSFYYSNKDKLNVRC